MLFIDLSSSFHFSQQLPCKTAGRTQVTRNFCDDILSDSHTAYSDYIFSRTLSEHKLAHCGDAFYMSETQMTVSTHWKK